MSDIATAALADHSTSQREKSSLSVTTGIASHLPAKRLQRPVNEDYGTKYFVIFSVLIRRVRI